MGGGGNRGGRLVFTARTKAATHRVGQWLSTDSRHKQLDVDGPSCYLVWSLPGVYSRQCSREGGRLTHG